MQGLKLIPKIKLDDSGVFQRLMISKECALEKEWYCDESNDYDKIKEIGENLI